MLHTYSYIGVCLPLVSPKGHYTVSLLSVLNTYGEHLVGQGAIIMPPRYIECVSYIISLFTYMLAM